jgi:uncharacterized protein involved in type VI secretion and phage assembly
MYTQANKDALFLTGYTFQEGISQLFRGQLDLLTEKKNIPFDNLVGQ